MAYWLRECGAGVIVSRRRTRSSSERDHLEPQGSRCRPRRHRRGIYPSGPAMSAGPPRCLPSSSLLGPVHAQNTVTTLTRLSAACAAVAAISLVQPVFAQTQAPAASPAPAEAAANRSPELSLQATASSEVKQDTVRIALAAEVEGRTSRLRARSSARCWTTWSSGRATPRASKCARVITTSGPIPAARARSPAGAGKAK